ncbi:MAG: alpha/beta hydrolase [Proteobacteria bacterium]|nr:alpha/beta hydrolase [Pseudomonadota bacterium]
MSVSKADIDAESNAALEGFLLQFPGGLNAISDLNERRAALNSVTKKIDEFEHSDIEVRDFQAPASNGSHSIPIRLYRAAKESSIPPKPCLIYIHGGGMIMGNLETGNLNCLNFARRFDIAVLSIEYRKAPEFPYPAAIEDCIDGISWIGSNAELFNIDLTNLGIYGSSAGGGLVLGTVLKMRDQGSNVFKYMLPIYPMIDSSNTSNSSLKVTNIGVWDRSTNIDAWSWYLNGNQADEYAAPAKAENLANLPQCYSDVGSFDLFLDENSLFFERLAKSGVSTEFHVFQGAFHGSENLAPESELSRKIWESRLGAIKRFIEN